MKAILRGSRPLKINSLEVDDRVESIDIPLPPTAAEWWQAMATPDDLPMVRAVRYRLRKKVGDVGYFDEEQRGDGD